MKTIISMMMLLCTCWAKDKGEHDLYIYPSGGRHSHDINQATIHVHTTQHAKLDFKDPSVKKIFQGINYATTASAYRVNGDDVKLDVYTPPVLYFKGRLIKDPDKQLDTLEVYDLYFQCPFVLVLGMGFEPFRDPLKEHAIIDIKNVGKYLEEIIYAKLFEDPIVVYPNILSFFRMPKEIKEPAPINQFEGVYPVLALSEQGHIKLLLSGNRDIDAKPVFNSKKEELEFMSQLRTALQAQQQDETMPPQIYVVGKVTGKKSEPVKTVKIYSWHQSHSVNGESSTSTRDEDKEGRDLEQTQAHGQQQHKSSTVASSESAAAILRETI